MFLWGEEESFRSNSLWEWVLFEVFTFEILPFDTANSNCLDKKNNFSLNLFKLNDAIFMMFAGEPTSSPSLFNTFLNKILKVLLNN